MTSSSWKERMFAFLLRRVLSPILDAQSLPQLQTVVSVREGRYTLQDIVLNTEYLQEKLLAAATATAVKTKKATPSFITIRGARIRRLTVELSLEEHHPSTTMSSYSNQTTQSSLAWRALQLGSTMTTTTTTATAEGTTTAATGSDANHSSTALPVVVVPKVSLVVHIEIDGAVLELEPCVVVSDDEQKGGNDEPVHTTSDNDDKPNPANVEHNPVSDTESSSSSSKSILSSYLDAVLKSLQLSVTLKNLSLRFWSGCRERSFHDENIVLSSSSRDPESCVQVRCQYISYQTIPKPLSESSCTTRQEYDTTLHKVITMQNVSILTGYQSNDGDDSTTTKTNYPSLSTIAVLEGSSRVIFRVIEYRSKQDSETNNNEAVSQRIRVEQDLEVSVNQKLNVSVDVHSLSAVKKVIGAVRSSVNSLSKKAVENLKDETSLKEQVPSDNHAADDDDDEADINTLTGIMKQYQEARQQVERNEFRGGILYPSISESSSSGGGGGCAGEVTFDAFFDANDTSFYHYSTVLRESVISDRVIIGGSSSLGNLVHTKVRLYIHGGGIKLVFPSSTSSAGQTAKTFSRRLEEYVLWSFHDLNVSSSFSQGSSDHSITIQSMQIEDSQLYNSSSDSYPPASQRVEIGSILRFSPGVLDDVLIDSPCISISVSTSSHRDEQSLVEVEIELYPVELSHHFATISNLVVLFDELKKADQAVDLSTTENVEGSFSKKENDCSFRLNAHCPSICIDLPVFTEKEWSGLYKRCGYRCDVMHSPRSSMCIHFEHVSIEAHSDETESLREDGSISVRNVFVYAVTPETGNILEKKFIRIDILALCGRSEVEPCIPVCMRFWRRKEMEGNNSQSEFGPAMECFPHVTPISSFKARQEDDEDDNRVDRILFSKMHGVDASTRKQLRGVDPQPELLAKAAQSDLVMSIDIPEILCDLTKEEVNFLQDMLLGVSPPGVKKYKERSLSTERDSPGKFLAVHVSIDSLSIGIHSSFSNDRNIEGSSFVLKTNSPIKSYVLVSDGMVESIRFLMDDFHFYEATNLSSPINVGRLSDSGDRIRHFHHRLAPREETTLRPIFYKSHLFEPISQTSPTVLIDLILPSLAPGESNEIAERNLYVTVYDVTHRFNFDAKGWIEGLKGMVARKEKDPTDSADIPSTITRVFISLADCNIDYSSSCRFATASRTILRVGDFRFSSNIVTPPAPTQAFSLALGDSAVYLCNNRFPYSFEDSCLFGSKEIAKDGIFREVASPTSEKVLHQMNCRTVLMLDSFDSVVAVSNSPPECSQDPSLRVSITAGEASIYTCKDSFARLMSTVGELAAELMALDDQAFETLKARPRSQAEDTDTFFDSMTGETPEEPKESRKSNDAALDALKKQSALRPTLGTDTKSDRSRNFLLDGYDWTTIDMDADDSLSIPSGEEQVARWFPRDKSKEGEEVAVLAGVGESEEFASAKLRKYQGPKIITHHFSLHPILDPLGDGDMGAMKYAGTKTPPRVKARIVVHDLAFKLRCFDGYDWPELLDDENMNAPRKGPFIIDHEPDKEREALPEKKDPTRNNASKDDTKAKLMNDLLLGPSETSITFKNVPLPEEKGRALKAQANLRRLGRRTNKYFQFSASGICLRMDCFEDSTEHRLASCLDLRATDFFVAETISCDRPIKMAGEWVSDQDHPRDTRDGLLSLKMVTWHPLRPVTEDNQIANDETEVGMKVLPLRCFLDQRAIRFASAFFRSDNDSDEHLSAPCSLPEGLHAVPPPLIQKFRCRPFKLKVDYKPERIDTKALRNGALVELVNLNSLDGLILTLQEVAIENEVGFGAVISILTRRWLQDVCATQLIKFLTNARPFEPIATVAGGVVDMVVLPWDAFQNGDSIQKALRAGASSFANAVTYETLTLSSRLGQFVADTISRATASPPSSLTYDDFAANPQHATVPSRPIRVPRRMADTSNHVVESLSRGFQTAGYKVVIIPYRQYHKSGATGAVRSVLKGIPVAIAAPTSGAAEALSFALLGARNQIRPDIRREEEASQRGLHLDE